MKTLLLLCVLLAVGAALATTPAEDRLYATRVTCELQTAGPVSMPTMYWQQGTTPLLSLDQYRQGKAVTADTGAVARVVIGPSAVSTYYVVATNYATSGNGFLVRFATVGTNTAAAAAGWWYTIYLERSGYRYWTGNGRLDIEATTSTEDGLEWQAITASSAVTNEAALRAAGDAAERAALASSGTTWRAEWRSTAGATGDVIRAQALAAMYMSNDAARAATAAGDLFDVRTNATGELTWNGTLTMTGTKNGGAGLFLSNAGTGDALKVADPSYLYANSAVATVTIDQLGAGIGLSVASGGIESYGPDVFRGTLTAAAATIDSGNARTNTYGGKVVILGSRLQSGNGATVTGDGGVAIGETAVAGAGAMALGSGNQATGDGSAAFGIVSIASGVASLAFGGNATASGVASAAIGNAPNATNDYTFVWSGEIAGYGSHGVGTFNIDPTNGASGFYVGGQTLAYLLAASAGATNAEHVAAADPHPGYLLPAEGTNLLSALWYTVALTGTNCTVTPAHGGAQRVGLTNAAATVVFSGWDSSRLQGVLFEFATGGTNYALTWPGTVVWASSIDVTSNRTYWVNLMNRGGSGYVAQPIVSW